MPINFTFDIEGQIVMLGWIVLILAPRRWNLLGMVPRLAVPLMLSAIYTVLVGANFVASGGGYDSLDAVRRLFANDGMLLAGWTHYLAFDLIVGALCADRMDRVGLPRILQAPLLVIVFMFGPIGFLLTIIAEGVLRVAPGKTVAPGETVMLDKAVVTP